MGNTKTNTNKSILQENLKVGTDFSGIGAPEMALKYLGINHESVFACEIDKYARQSFEQLHNPTTFYNDISKRNHKEVKQLDLYVAGFPCQAFSIAGNRKGFDEARGTLFFDVAEFIQINKPKVFVLENVKGLLSHDKGRTFQTIVDILTNGGGTQNGQISLDVFDDGLGYHIYW
jgi:DNA (cytosine-5)-methyltransferase 1